MKALILRLLTLLVATLIATTAPAAGQTDYRQVADTILELGESAIRDYTPEQPEATAMAFSSIYFDVFETSGMEFALTQADEPLMLSMELRFGELTRMAMNRAPRADLERVWGELVPQLQQAGALLGQGEEASATGTAVQAALIVLREGVEALLVITALVAYLRRSGQHGHVRAIWIGVALALVASALTAWLFNTLVAASGAAREAIEGLCLLVAAGLLAWVSLWIYSRREAARWQQYLKDQLDAALATDSAWALAGTAFLAVYREGAETVLFLQALGGAQQGMSAVATGAVAAGVALVGVWWALDRAALRLPIRPFFTLTALLLFVLAVVFAGKGVLELQVAGWIGITRWPLLPEWPLVGIFPTVETATAQALVIATAALALSVATLRARRPAS